MDILDDSVVLLAADIEFKNVRVKRLAQRKSVDGATVQCQQYGLFTATVKDSGHFVVESAQSAHLATAGALAKFGLEDHFSHDGFG